MLWIRVDEAMPHHPKIVAAGPQAFALDVAAICYSRRYDTNGFIADRALNAVLPGLTQPKRYARLLCDVGRWIRNDELEGYDIHDFDDYQYSAEEWADMAAAKSAKSIRANHKRWHERRGIVSPDCPLCVPDVSHKESHGDESGTPPGIPGGIPHYPTEQDKTEPEVQGLQGVANEPESVSTVPPVGPVTEADSTHRDPETRAVDLLKRHGKTHAGAVELIEAIGVDAVLEKFSEAS